MVESTSAKTGDTHDEATGNTPDNPFKSIEDKLSKRESIVIPKPEAAKNALANILKSLNFRNFRNFRP